MSRFMTVNIYMDVNGTPGEWSDSISQSLTYCMVIVRLYCVSAVQNSLVTFVILCNSTYYIVYHESQSLFLRVINYWKNSSLHNLSLPCFIPNQWPKWFIIYLHSYIKIWHKVWNARLDVTVVSRVLYVIVTHQIWICA